MRIARLIGLVGAALALANVGHAHAAAMTAADWIDDGEEAAFFGETDEAIASFTKALALEPTNAKAFAFRGMAKNDKRDYAGAIADLDKAIALNPKDPAYIYSERGYSRRMSNNLDGAMEDYNRALALEPDEPADYDGRGWTKNAKKDFDGAIADFSKAIQLDPKDMDYRRDRATALRQKGDFAGAVADYDVIVTAEPKNEGTINFRGFLKLIQGETRAAIVDIEKAMVLKPDYVPAYHNRALGKATLGDFEGSVSDLGKAIEFAKDAAEVDWGLRETLLRRLNRPTPFGELARTVAKWEASWEKTIGLYLIEAVSEADFLAEAAKGDAKTVSTRRCVANYFIGMTKLQAGDKAAAQRHFEASVATNETTYDEFILSRAELARLGAAR